jgi:hypothetical protein
MELNFADLLKATHVRRRDLVQIAIALAGIVLVDCHPIVFDLGPLSAAEAPVDRTEMFRASSAENITNLVIASPFLCDAI